MALPSGVADLEGQVVLVTGAARGQGRAHAEALAAAGADIAALDLCATVEIPAYALGRHEDLAATVAAVEALDRRCLDLVADVRDSGAVTAAIGRTVTELGRLDVVINNAAIVTSAPFWELSDAEWHAVIDTDLGGVWRVAKAAAPHVRRAPRGRIINIGSTASQKALAEFAHYIAAKHGVVGLTRAMAIELAPDDVTVNALLPGAVDSPMLAGLAQELGLTSQDVHETFMHDQLFSRVAQPEQVTAALLWLLSEAADHVTGQCLGIDGGSLAT